MPHALITGASFGLGRAVAFELARRGWDLTIDARHAEPLASTAQALSELTSVRAISGDVGDPSHREQLVAAAAAAGQLGLVINNASDLGGSPLPKLRDLEPAAYELLLRTNVVAPQQLIRAALPYLEPQAVIINVSSDAGVDHYETWGGYGSSKAALDHQTLTWAAEEPDFTWYSLDPGDMRTAMHQAAFPSEDISDRPEPETVAPIVVALIGSGLQSGRYRAADLDVTLAEKTRSE
ncbi:MAG TPA: SDR family oxidoreductase [Propionibacteriaceae bacterium]|jgi:NAD(P)-dependent dehydrogenase (short-subunit alcohol dehydrogenase family)|nr:SDR family oxidoreductase [Propionibacteriaceae bacterium]